MREKMFGMLIFFGFSFSAFIYEHTMTTIVLKCRQFKRDKGMIDSNKR